MAKKGEEIRYCRAGLKKGAMTGAIPIVEETFRDRDGVEHTCYHGSCRVSDNETLSIYVSEPNGGLATKKGDKEIRYYVSITSFKSRKRK